MKRITNFPNYSVKRDGTVYSHVRNKPLSPDIGKVGYQRVSLCREGVVTRCMVHRLVAEAFIPNPRNKPHVNHIDNDPSNNNVSNLEWCTPRENTAHSASQGRQDISRELGMLRAQALANDEAVKYYTSRLGDRFVKITSLVKSNSSRVYVNFICESCSSEVSCRGDAAPLRKRNGICNACARMKI